MTSINLLCQHIKFVIWYRLVFPIRCISRTPNYNKNMMFPLLSYTYENISFRSHHVHSFSHAFCSITFPAHHFPAAGSRPVCHCFLRRADCRAFPAPSIRAHGFSACYRLWLAPACLYVGDTSKPVIYLTFDAGYENGCTPAILEALKKHHVPATFFVVGNYLETSPELVKQMIAEGHTVANHTYHHPDMSRISDKAAFEKELTALETLYQSVTGQTMKKYYRPPQGKYSESNLQMAKELGYKTFFWSLAYVDWMQDQQPSKEEAFSKLLTRIHPGAIVLLHSTSQTNAQILDELLAKWEEMGYQFGQLDEL